MSDSRDLYKILFYKGFPETLLAKSIVYLFTIFKFFGVNRIRRIFPVSLHYRFFLNLDFDRKDFEEALIYVLYGNIYELFEDFSLTQNKFNVVVDVGAHLGFYTIKAARAAKTVVSIEPYGRCLTVLYSNRDANRATNVRIVPVAASDKNGRAMFVAGNALDTGFIELGDSVKGDRRILVCTRRLDDLLRKLDVDLVDLMKIDVEGGEEAVLSGLLGYLSQVKTERIVMEVHSEALLRAVRKRLKTHGYFQAVFRLSSHGHFIVYARLSSQFDNLQPHSSSFFDSHN